MTPLVLPLDLSTHTRSRRSSDAQFRITMWERCRKAEVALEGAKAENDALREVSFKESCHVLRLTFHVSRLTSYV